MNYSKQINDKIDELQQEYFTCNTDSLKSLQIEYELDYLYHLKNKIVMTDKQKEAIKVLNKVSFPYADNIMSEEDYMAILEAIWDNDVKDKVQVQPIPFNIPAYQLPCYHPDGVCINPQKDCVNCPKQGTYDFTWTTNTNTTIKKD